MLNACQKPVDLYRWLIRHFSDEQVPVLSLFEGAGTGSMAALLEGRDVLAVDYCMEMVAGTVSRVLT